MSRPRKITHSRGPSYEITYRVDGRMVSRRFPRKQASVHAATRARSEILDGTHIAPAEGRTTVAEYVAMWLQTLEVRPYTFHNDEIYLRCHVPPALGRRSPASLRRSDIQALVGQMSRKGLKTRTVDSIYKIVAMVMRSADYGRLIPDSDGRRRTPSTVCWRRRSPVRHRRDAVTATTLEARLMHPPGPACLQRPAFPPGRRLRAAAPGRPRCRSKRATTPR